MALGLRLFRRQQWRVRIRAMSLSADGGENAVRAMSLLAMAMAMAMALVTPLWKAGVGCEAEGGRRARTFEESSIGSHGKYAASAHPLSRGGHEWVCVGISWGMRGSRASSARRPGMTPRICVEHDAPV